MEVVHKIELGRAMWIKRIAQRKTPTMLYANAKKLCPEIKNAIKEHAQLGAIGRLGPSVQ